MNTVFGFSPCRFERPSDKRLPERDTIRWSANINRFEPIINNNYMPSI